MKHIPENKRMSYHVRCLQNHTLLNVILGNTTFKTKLTELILYLNQLLLSGSESLKWAKIDRYSSKHDLYNDLPK